MKTNLRMIFLLTVFCLCFGCGASVFGQSSTVLGGYKSASVSDASVKAAANFAVEQKASDMEVELSLENIIKAEVQQLRGANYRLCLELYVPAKEEETDGVQLFVKTVIFKDPQGEYKITSWEESDCAEK